MCRAFVSSLSALKPSTAQVYLSRVSAIFVYAIKQDYITSNPMVRVQWPKSIKTTNIEDVAWTADQLSRFLDVCKNDENPQIYPFFRVLAMCGLRVGEARALTWSDIDFNKNTISVNQTMTVTHSPDGTGSTKSIGTPKTVASMAKVMMDIETADSLRSLHDLKLSTDFVFANPTTGQPRSWMFASYQLSKLSKCAQVPTIKVHGLRHTFCSLLIQAQVPLSAAQGMMRHSNLAQVMSVYTHFYDQDLRDASNTLSDIVAKSTSKTTPDK